MTGACQAYEAPEGSEGTGDSSPLAPLQMGHDAWERLGEHSAGVAEFSRKAMQVNERSAQVVRTVTTCPRRRPRCPEMPHGALAVDQSTEPMAATTQPQADMA